MQKFLITSLTLHLGIFLILSTGSVFNFSGKTILIEDTIQVDLVGLPSFTQTELEKMNNVTEEIIEEVESKDSSKEKVDDKADLVISKKEIKKKKSEKKVIAKTKKIKKINKDLFKELGRLAITGNQISKGSSATGNIGSKDQKEIQIYLSRLKTRVQKFWVLPNHLINRDYRSLVRVFISRTGRLMKALIVKSSGNKEYDQKVLKVVKSAEPFDKPDAKIVDKLESGEVTLQFPFI